MTVVRAQCAFKTSATLARDDMLITPHFNFESPIQMMDDFAHDLALALQGWQSATATPRKVEVRLYDAEGAAPHYPLATFTTPTGDVTELTWPRELALCLSFYSEHNRPRNRGRLYVCPGWMFTGTTLNQRPTQVLIDKVMALGVVLKDAGGPDVDWSVWSRVDKEARPVTDYWCDDEWDIQRRRGQKATKRSTAVTSEA